MRLLSEALFADDCTLMVHSESDLQIIVNRFDEASRLFGLEISLRKMEVLHQPDTSSIPTLSTISIEDMKLKNVEQFKYLFSIISSVSTLDKEVSACINRASQSLGCLHSRVLNHKNIDSKTKIEAYKAVVLASLLYGWL